MTQYYAMQFHGNHIRAKEMFNYSLEIEIATPSLINQTLLGKLLSPPPVVVHGDEILEVDNVPAQKSIRRSQLSLDRHMTQHPSRPYRTPDSYPHHNQNRPSCPPPPPTHPPPPPPPPPYLIPSLALLPVLRCDTCQKLKSWQYF